MKNILFLIIFLVYNCRGINYYYVQNSDCNCIEYDYLTESDSVNISIGGHYYPAKFDGQIFSEIGINISNQSNNNIYIDSRALSLYSNYFSYPDMVNQLDTIFAGTEKILSFPIIGELKDAFRDSLFNWDINDTLRLRFSGFYSDRKLKFENIIMVTSTWDSF
jgi:hypothetical protein